MMDFNAETVARVRELERLLERRNNGEMPVAASQAEVDAGTNTRKIVTPATLAGAALDTMKVSKVYESDGGGPALSFDADGVVQEDITQVAGTDMYPGGSIRGLLHRFYGYSTPDAVEDDFDYTGESPTSHGWSVAFTTPTFSVSNGILFVYGLTAARSFLYKSITPGASDFIPIYGLLACGSQTSGDYAGLRLDDGTDNNFLEMRLQVGTSMYNRSMLVAIRTGGGSVTTNGAVDALAPFETRGFLLQAFNTLWSSWGHSMRWFNDSFGAYNWIDTTLGGAKTWTPARAGIVCYFSQSYHQLQCPYIGGQIF